MWESVAKFIVPGSPAAAPMPVEGYKISRSIRLKSLNRLSILWPEKPKVLT